MKLKNIVIVAALFLGLLAYILKFDIPSTEYKQAERKPFYDTGKAQLSSFQIKRADQAFKLKNTQPKAAVNKSALDDNQARIIDAVAPDEWIIENLAYGKVDAANLNAIITQIVAFELGEPLPAKELEGDLSLYGLSKPEVEATIEKLDKYSTPKQVKFEFGKKSEFLAKRYVRYTRIDGSSDIFLTDDLLFFALNKSRNDFRRKEPVEFSEADLEKLNFSGSGLAVNIQLEKKPAKLAGSKEQVWNLVTPSVGSADQAKVSEVLKNLKSLKASDYLEGQEAEAMAQHFDNANITATLYKKGELSNPLNIRVLSDNTVEKPKTYFRIDGISTVFVSDSNPTAAMLDNPDSFRKTQFFDIDVDQVQSFDLGGSYVLGIKGEKTDQTWKIGEKSGDETFIRQWLLDIKELKAQGFPLEGNDYGFATPNYKLTVKVGTSFEAQDIKPVERVLVIGAPEKIEGGRPLTYYAAVDDLSEPFIISKGDMDKIIPKPEALVVLPTAAPTVAPTVQP